MHCQRQGVVQVGRASTSTMPPRPPAIMPGVRLRTETPFGHLHVTIVVDPKTGREYEVFAQIGHLGELVAADVEAMCRLASLYMRLGGSLQDVAKQLKGIGSNITSDQATVSVPDSLGQALALYLREKKKHGVRALILGEARVGEAPDEPQAHEETKPPVVGEAHEEAKLPVAARQGEGWE
jgi:ribonucleoside-diphosphate reductase alpha chain